MKTYTQRQFSTLTGIPRTTLQNWAKNGKLILAVEENGARFYSEEQIELAKSLKRSAKKTTPSNETTKKSALPDTFDDDAQDDSEELPADVAPNDDDTGDGELIDQHNTARDFDSYLTLASNDANVSEGTAALDGQEPAENDSGSGLPDKCPEVQTAAPMDDDQNEKINSDATTFSGVEDTPHLESPADLQDDSNCEVNAVVEVPTPVEVAAPPITDLVHANVTIETAPFIDELKVVSLEGKTLQELADESRLCFERGDDCLKQGAMYYVEGGRRLIEAKRRLKHGEWQKWLKENFAFSQDTAENRMKLATRFGESKSETFRNLKPATLIKLLALPVGDEERFIEAQVSAGKPIEDLSAREVQKAVVEWKQRATVPEQNKSEVGDEVFPIVDFGRGNPLTDSMSDPVKKKPPITNRRDGANYEWYTPQKYVSAVRDVLGGIDFDPTSCEKANETVKAEKFLTADDDTLNANWSGRVFMNPPFTQPLIEQLVDKFVNEYSVGNIAAGIVLTHNCTETDWFIKLAQMSAGILFTDHRINFLDAGIESAGTAQRGQRGQAFFYFGSDPEKFFEVFGKFGWGVQLVATAAALKKGKQ